ncbi:MAG TPA: response regulator transcription factor [Fimbriimonas sp.]|nr:response regulator transcription factor [Fimbriimonas sp.]
MRVLLVEDDPEMMAMVLQVLVRAGFTVDCAADGREALKRALSQTYSLVILDLMIPLVDGLAVCSELRARRRNMPILMMTARDSVTDRVAGLDTGADDYLPKPFDVREFVARVHALLRRDKVLKSRRLYVCGLAIDTRRREVAFDGRPLPLTKLEYGILETLAGQVGRTVPRETLLELIWRDQEPGSNKLEVAVRSLRRKLETIGLGKLVQTVYGYGYTIRDEQGLPAQ